MKRSILSKCALILFMGFVSTAMTVDVASESEFFTCHLVSLGGNTQWDYDCDGTCPRELPCYVTVWQWTVGCHCGNNIPWHECSGEFSFAPDPFPQGLFCYTSQGCSPDEGYPEGLECVINKSQTPGPKRACICATPSDSDQ